MPKNTKSSTHVPSKVKTISSAQYKDATTEIAKYKNMAAVQATNRSPKPTSSLLSTEKNKNGQEKKEVSAKEEWQLVLQTDKSLVLNKKNIYIFWCSVYTQVVYKVASIIPGSLKLGFLDLC